MCSASIAPTEFPAAGNQAGCLTVREYGAFAHWYKPSQLRVIGRLRGLEARPIPVFVDLLPVSISTSKLEGGGFQYLRRCGTPVIWIRHR